MCVDIHRKIHMHRDFPGDPVVRMLSTAPGTGSIPGVGEQRFHKPQDVAPQNIHGHRNMHRTHPHKRMHTYKYTEEHVCSYKCTHGCSQKHAHTATQVPTHTITHKKPHVHSYTQKHTCMSLIHTRVHTRVYTRVHIHTGRAGTPGAPSGGWGGSL